MIERERKGEEASCCWSKLALELVELEIACNTSLQTVTATKQDYPPSLPPTSLSLSLSVAKVKQLRSNHTLPLMPERL